MTRLQLKRLVGEIAGYLRRSTERDVILLYHSIGDTPWAVPERHFREQMEWLGKEASVVSLSEIMRASGPRKLRVAVTFDDGYAAVYRAASPIARDLHLRPTIFINTGLIGQQRRVMSCVNDGHYPNEEFLLWYEVERLARDGWAIGSHGVTHADLTRADAETACRQVRQSKTTIEQQLCTACDYFSYTWGRHSRTLQALVNKAGYEYGFAGRHGPLGQQPNPFAVPRIAIPAECSLADFRAIVSGDWDYLGRLQDLKRHFAH